MSQIVTWGDGSGVGAKQQTLGSGSCKGAKGQTLGGWGGGRSERNISAT